MYCFPPTKFSSPLTMLVKQNIVLSNYLYFDFFATSAKAKTPHRFYFFCSYETMPKRNRCYYLYFYFFITDNMGIALSTDNCLVYCRPPTYNISLLYQMRGRLTAQRLLFALCLLRLNNIQIFYCTKRSLTVLYGRSLVNGCGHRCRVKLYKRRWVNVA